MSETPDPDDRGRRDAASSGPGGSHIDSPATGGGSATPSRSAEESLSAILEAIPNPAFLMDVTGTVARANQAVIDRLGLDVREVVGACAYDLLPESLAQELRRHAETVIHQGKAERFAGRCGERPAEHIIAPVCGADGRILQLCVLCIDTGEREETEEESLRAQLRQAQKMEALGQLATRVAHDFNNTLTVIRGCITRACALLPPGNEARQCLGQVLDATHQATGLTRSLLAFSRRLPVEKRPVDLRRLVVESTELVRATLPAWISLEANLPPAAPLWVQADESQIHQVVLNLAINARDAMPVGGILRMAVRAVEKRGPDQPQDAPPSPAWAELLVSDSGEGIAPDNLGKIFEPFFTTKTHGQHSGLGLAIVRSIVREHDGQVEVRSEAGKGTTFTIQLPCIESGATPRPLATQSSMPPGSGEQVLLAESNPHVGGIIALTLESLGYEVMRATDAATALETAERQGPLLRVAILETDLPGGRGLVCLRQMRERGLGLPAILLTGNEAPDPAEVDRNTTLLPKPFDMPELARLVYNALQNASRKEDSPS
jgi:two-component system, cell cycle sensor histidine kinase and response regulator CckA